MKKFIKNALVCLTALVVSLAGHALTPFASVFVADGAAATTTTANTDMYYGIEQVEISMKDLVANNYEVTVDVFFNYAENGILSTNDIYLYFAPIESPDNDETILDPLNTDARGNALESGLYLNGIVSRNFSSENFSTFIGAYTDANGIVHTSCYGGKPVYNDYSTEEPGRITLCSIKFTVPQTAAAGDQYNIVWWDEKNSENKNGYVYDADNNTYSGYHFVDGFIKISEEETVECAGITCSTDFIGNFYADDQTAVSFGDLQITAIMNDGDKIDITADCAFVNDPTPYYRYWTVYDDGIQILKFTVNVIYNGSNTSVADYCETNGTSIIGSAIICIAQRGDANLDHAVDTRDAAAMAKYSSLKASLDQNAPDPTLCEDNDELAKCVSDVNGDGVIDTRDAACDAKYASMSASYAGDLNQSEKYVEIWSSIVSE